MKTPRYTLFFILIVTVVAVVVDLPQGIPLKFSIGPLKINRVISPPPMRIPFLGIDRQIATQLGLDLQGGTQLILEVDMKNIGASDRDTALASSKEIIERRVNFFGVSEPVVQSAKVGENYRIIVELPGVTNIDQALSTVGQTAQLELREMIEKESSTAAFFIPIESTKPTGITGADFEKAEVGFHQETGEPIVNFELTDEGGKKFAEVTKRMIGKRLPIFLDQFAISAPVVESEIPSGKGIISGNFTREEAKRLALQLSAGALPAPITIVEQRNIGASLGALSVEKSIRAGLIGLTLVLFFMILYYGKMGLIADIALIIYGLLTFALFRLIPVTLTLPGIAGFILSIGMAVDSNILIFERYKEEVRKGKPWHIALELAFGRAWDSIRDANVTTLITAFILYNPLNWNFLPVSGMVRGFAFTLTLGVLVSLFTGLFVSRNLLRAFYRPKEKREALSVKR